MKKIILLLIIIFLCGCNFKSVLPKPEVTGGERGKLGIDKNINELTIDNYLNRTDSVSIDLRMLKDERYYPLTARLSLTDAIIVFLKYKFINNKEYTIPQISEFLRIPEEEVTNKIKYISGKYQAIIDKLYYDYEKEYIISRRKKKK